MQAGMYSGLFGALTTEHRMNFIANYLANVNTLGYKLDSPFSTCAPSPCSRSRTMPPERA